MLNFIMGNGSAAQKINFEDMQKAINDKNISIISTLPTHKQDCLISNTLTPVAEIECINNLQLIKLGFKNIAIYSGGLFEWLLLQDIYSEDLFPTKGTATDMLLYKGSSKQHALNPR